MKTIRGGIRGVIEVSQTLQSFFRGLDEAENKKRNSDAWKNFTPADAEPLSLWLLPVLLPACVCCARVTVAAVVIVTCLMLPVFRALLPLPRALLPQPLMISTRNF